MRRTVGHEDLYREAALLCIQSLGVQPERAGTGGGQYEQAYLGWPALDAIHVNPELTKRTQQKISDLLEQKCHEPHAPPDAFACLAAIRQREGHQGEAIRLYRQALASNFGRSDWHLSLATVLAATGATAEAMEEAKICFAASAAICSGAPVHRGPLVPCWFAAGRVKVPIAWWEACVSHAAATTLRAHGVPTAGRLYPENRDRRLYTDGDGVCAGSVSIGQRRRAVAHPTRIHLRHSENVPLQVTVHNAGCGKSGMWKERVGLLTWSAPSTMARRLATGTFWLLAGTVVWRVLTAVSAIFVARILGGAAFGELAMVRSTVDLFVVFGSFRLGSTATKYVSQYRHTDPPRAGAILLLVSIVSLVTCFAMGALCLALSPWLAEGELDRADLKPVITLQCASDLLRYFAAHPGGCPRRF